MEYRLNLENITKTFPGVVAVNKANIKIKKGEDISSKFIKNEDLEFIKSEIVSIKFYKGIGENSEIVFIKKNN